MPDITVSSINAQLLSDKDSFISECERDYRNQLYKISGDIFRCDGRVLVMLAGPSSSGKTTTAGILNLNQKITPNTAPMPANMKEINDITLNISDVDIINSFHPC